VLTGGGAGGDFVVFFSFFFLELNSRKRDQT